MLAVELVVAESYNDSPAVPARQLHLRFPGSQLEPLLARCPTDDLEDFADLLVTASDLDTLSRWLVAHQGT